jgi:hypothetical protein
VGLALREERFDEMDHISYRIERYQYYTTVSTKLFLRQFAFLWSDWSGLYSALILRNRSFIPVFNYLLVFCAGCDVVDWLHAHVEGFLDRRDARKYASQMLKAGYIRHTVNKITFSEQCYYVFGDLCAGEYVCSQY